MQAIVRYFFKLLEILIVVFVVAMVVMVFGNVVLRYGFNSGISISDEMSRYCFIWLTYVGAMVASVGMDGSDLRAGLSDGRNVLTSEILKWVMV